MNISLYNWGEPIVDRILGLGPLILSIPSLGKIFVFRNTLISFRSRHLTKGALP